MDRIAERVRAVRRSPALLVALGVQAVVVLALLLTGSRLWVVAVGALAATAVVAVRTAGQAGLQVDQMQRLRQAELALAAARDTHDAAQELADHAMALLGAPHATVLIEGIGDTVRVSRGDPSASVYGDGSRMRLLDDAGVPCGSIAVSARADGRAYTDQQEHMLDALAQRVSSTLHRLSLIADVEAERRTIADVLESSSDGIFTVGLDMAVRTWNPAMERILGVPADRALGSPVATVFRPADEEGRPRHGQADPGRLGRPEVALVRVEAAGGDERWLTCSWAPLSEGGYVVVARDDTERKKLQDDKDGWIAQVSHELRTPLTPIKGFLHTLQRRDAEFETDQRQRIYEVMVREEQRLEDLVNALLQATTIDRRAVVVVPEALDWPSLLRDQAELYQRNDPTRAVQVVVDPDVHAVVADANLAAGVVANLLSNALKYSPPGSEIEVRARREGVQVVTTVTDRGPGVPPGDRERIFDKFTRLGDHLTRPQQGVGLGLYIARSSVEQMGGRIWCADAPSGGATFGFTLPVHAERADRPASAVPA